MSCLDFSFSCAILQNRALSDARVLIAKVFLYLYMTPCCVSWCSLQVFFYFYIRTNKIQSETSKNKSMAFQKFIQCSGSCFSSSHWFWWVHSNQITVLHFQGTPLPFGNEVCLMLHPGCHRHQVCDLHCRQNGRTMWLLTEGVVRRSRVWRRD